MMKSILRFLVILFCCTFLIVGALRVTMLLLTNDLVYDLDSVPPEAVVMVPGAGLTYQGGPSLPLKDRLDAAIALYNSGKVQKLLFSGDNSDVNYNEPGAMKTYAIENGIPEADIVLDYAGRRTYDSCYRAKAIFGLEEIIVVTQPYHLPRMTFLCSKLGIKTEGLPVEQSQYIRQRFLFWNFREVFATLVAYWDIYIAKPLPVLGDPEPIFK